MNCARLTKRYSERPSLHIVPYLKFHTCHSQSGR